MIKKLLLAACFLIVGVAVLAHSVYRGLWLSSIPVPEQGYTFVVKPGQSLRSVLNQLERDGLVQYPRLLGLIVRIKDRDSAIHAGEYYLEAETSVAGLFDQLTNGKVIQYLITFPEGITFAEALERLHRAEGISATISADNPATYTDLITPYSHPEGLFLPESYQYIRGDSDLDVLSRARRDLDAVLAKAWESRDLDLPYKTPYELLTMASIVERETSVPSERAEIAGVFVRRLQKGMRLQTDPTIIYGLGSAYDGNLTKAHLRDKENPYNTYQISGLPPTPIALPSEAAIEAAAAPADGDWLYFVAKGDGSHAFAATLDEHQQNVRAFQLQRRKDYRSTPE